MSSPKLKVLQTTAEDNSEAKELLGRVTERIATLLPVPPGWEFCLLLKQDEPNGDRCLLVASSATQQETTNMMRDYIALFELVM